MITSDTLPSRPVVPPQRADSWVFPEVSDSRLPSGARVVAVDLPTSALTSARILVDRPLALEPRDGLFELLGQLWSDSHPTLSAQEYAQALEALGATVSPSAAYAGWDIALSVPVRHLAASLALAIAPLRAPSYTEEPLSRALRAHAAEHERRLDEPRSRASIEGAAITFASDNRASRPLAGTPASLEGITVDELREAHAAHVMPGSVTVVVAGALGGLDIAAIVDEAFGGWEGPVSEPLLPGPLVGGPPGARATVSRPAAPQTALRWAVALEGLSPRDWIATRMACDILGGGLSSRLMVSLREERGLTYGIGAGAHRSSATGGSLAIATQVESSAVEEAIAEVERIVAEALDGGFTQEELDRVTAGALTREPMGMQSSAGVVGVVVDSLRGGLAPNGIDEARRTYVSLTTEEVLAALRSAIPEGSLTLARVGA